MHPRLAPTLLVLALGCRDDGSWEPVVLSAGVPFVDIAIDGSWHTCLVDTGATVNLVHSTVHESGEAELTLGSETLHSVVVSDPSADPIIDDLSDLTGLQVDCLLGWDALEEVGVTLDYAGERIRFAGQRRRGWRIDDPVVPLGDRLVVPLVTTRPIPMVEARFQDVEIIAGVDTGASLALLLPDVFRQLSEPPETRPSQVSSADGVVMAELGTLSQVSFADEVVPDVAFVSYASLQLEGMQEERDIDGLIGASILARYAVTFDDRRSRLVLQPYPDDIAAELVDDITRSGFQDPRNPFD